jgi:sortase A
MPGHLVIEAVGIDAPVVPVGWHTVEQDGQLTSAWEVAEYAAGWHQNSALPGEVGNMVLSAHSNISGEVFRFLPEVKQGDRIKVYVGEQIFEYEITETTIVKESGEPPAVRRQNARWIAPTPDERLTLVTCWPYPYSTHRFIAVAKPL